MRSSQGAIQPPPDLVRRAVLEPVDPADGHAGVGAFVKAD
jgi:hypothetical protein